jgi:hypothetical protein
MQFIVYYDSFLPLMHGFISVAIENVDEQL